MARDISSAAARIGDPLRRVEQEPELRSSEAFIELLGLIEELENRRRVLRVDLDHMVTPPA